MTMGFVGTPGFGQISSGGSGGKAIGGVATGPPGVGGCGGFGQIVTGGSGGSTIGCVGRIGQIISGGGGIGGSTIGCVGRNGGCGQTSGG
jgi:hypothetical protein